MLRYLPFLLIIGLTIYTFIDCLNTPEEEVKHLPKVVWVIIILLFSIVGPVVWLFAGKKRVASGGGAGRGRGRTQWVAPDDNPDFLNSLREQQRAKQRDEKRQNEQDEQDGDKDGEQDQDGDKDGDKGKDRDNRE
ncbi:PLD nuclease N-terminal domain-containing protein [Streptomyces sp. NPDC089799]|uniref:PLD nuclease N-terminal domain-containing protein n=1 Tax=Streptomyces sp. NPDC089799 TaxID=3155066 RepID=UPI00341AAD52